MFVATGEELRTLFYAARTYLKASLKEGQYGNGYRSVGVSNLTLMKGTVHMMGQQESLCRSPADLCLGPIAGLFLGMAHIVYSVLDRS